MLIISIFITAKLALLHLIFSWNCPITLSNYNFADKLEKNTEVDEPITLKEMVIIVMISSLIFSLAVWLTRVVLPWQQHCI